MTGNSFIIPKKTHKVSKITRRASSKKDNVTSIGKMRDRKATSRKSVGGPGAHYAPFYSAHGIKHLQLR